MKKIPVSYNLKTLGVISAKEQVAEQLRQAIYTGELMPGAELIQEEIAAQLGVSRIPVREAFQILASAGIIEIQKNKRAIVNEITPESISEQMEIRTILECLAAEKASDRADDVSSLEEINAQMRKLKDAPNYDFFKQLNTQFHYELWRLAQSPRLEKILQQLWFSIPSVYPSDITGNILRNISEHDQILKALKARDKTALKEALIRHINSSEQLIIDRIPSK